MWYELNDLNEEGFMVILFSSVGQNKGGRLVIYLFRWQYKEKIHIWVIYSKSVIPKYSIHTGVVTDRHTFT